MMDLEVYYFPVILWLLYRLKATHYSHVGSDASLNKSTVLPVVQKYSIKYAIIYST
jgi:hypothetical protein